MGFNQTKDETFSSSGYTQYESTIFGYPIEAELLLSSAISNSDWGFFIGIGGGFYYYEDEVKSYTPDYFKQKIEINGLAQYLTFGTDLFISENVTAFLQCKKLGYSLITAEEKWGLDRNKVTVRAAPGLQDLGVSVGFKIVR